VVSSHITTTLLVLRLRLSHREFWPAVFVCEAIFLNWGDLFSPGEELSIGGIFFLLARETLNKGDIFSSSWGVWATHPFSCWQGSVYCSDIDTRLVSAAVGLCSGELKTHELGLCGWDLPFERREARMIGLCQSLKLQRSRQGTFTYWRNHQWWVLAAFLSRDALGNPCWKALFEALSLLVTFLKFAQLGSSKPRAKQS